MKKKVSRQKENILGSYRVCNKSNKQKKFSFLIFNNLERRKRNFITLQIQKIPIERIIRGGFRQAIQYQQVQKNCCFEEYMTGYNDFQQIKDKFPKMIKKNQLTDSLIFLDFKAKNYQLLSSYAFSQNIIKEHVKNKKLDDQTSSTNKSSFQNQYFKQKEKKVKEMTRNVVNVIRQHKKNKNRTLTQEFFIKNLEKMYQKFEDQQLKIGNKIPIIDEQVELRSKVLQLKLKVKAKKDNQRLYTTPSFDQSDYYAMEETSRKTEKHKVTKEKEKKNSQKIINKKDNARVHTEYQIDQIEDFKKKTKKNSQKQSKRSSLSKGKSFAKSGSLKKKVLQGMRR